MIEYTSFTEYRKVRKEEKARQKKKMTSRAKAQAKKEEAQTSSILDSKDNPLEKD
jgi:hypothetical protein